MKNIFDSPAEALVNPVNCVGVMGTGLAHQFAKRYPKMYLEYRKACVSGELKPGKIHVYQGPDYRYILNFPTKTHWREKSKLEYIEQGLEELENVLSDYLIYSVAIPALGCGLGGLDWEEVGPLLENFKPKGARVEIFPPR